MDAKLDLSALTQKIAGSKRYKYTLIISVAALAVCVYMLSFLPLSCAKTAENTDAKAQQTAGEGDLALEQRLERRLEELLQSMEGVGRARVMITLESAAEQIVASDERKSGSDGSYSSELRPATVSNAGREEPIVITELMPRVRGVIVLAEGAGDIRVKYNITAAVRTVLGIDEGSVEVFVMR